MNHNNTDPIMDNQDDQPKKQGFITKMKAKVAGWKQNRKEKSLRKQAEKEGHVSSESDSPTSPEKQPGDVSPAFGNIVADPITTETLAGGDNVLPADAPMMIIQQFPALGETVVPQLTTEQILAQERIPQELLSTEELLALPQRVMPQLPPQTFAYTYIGQELSQSLQQSLMSTIQEQSSRLEQSPALSNASQPSLNQIQLLPDRNPNTNNLTGMDVAQENIQVHQHVGEEPTGINQEFSFGHMPGNPSIQLPEIIMREHNLNNTNSSGSLPENF
jgi:hypothetical protein